LVVDQKKLDYFYFYFEGERKRKSGIDLKTEDRMETEGTTPSRRP